MLSIERALTWEFCRKNRWHWILGLAGPVGFAALMATILFVGKGDLKLDSDFLFKFYRVIFAITLVCPYAVWIATHHDPDRKRLGLPLRLYALPIATWRLAGCQMALNIAAGCLFSLVTGVSYGFIFGAMAPLIGPALLIAVLLAGLQGFCWLLVDFAILRILAVVAALAAVTPYAEPLAQAYLVPAESISLMTWLLAAGSIACFYAIGVIGIARERRGGAQGNPWLRQFLDRTGESASRRQKPFSSPEAAHFWFEWKQKGYIYPCGLAFIHLTILLICLYHRVGAVDTLLVLLGFSYALLIWLAPFVGLGLGQASASSWRWEMSVFRATRPMTDRALAWTILKTCAASALAAWTVCLVAVALTAAGYALAGQGADIERFFMDMKDPRAGFGFEQWVAIAVVCVTPLASWALLGLGASLTLTGRSWPAFAAIAVFVACAVWSLWSAQFWAVAVPFSIIGGLSLSAVLWAYNAAFPRRIPGLREILLILAVLTALSTLSIQFLPGGIFLIGLVALAFSPPAFAPLAVAWNRHR